MSLDTKIGENLHSLSKILYDAAKKEFPLWEKAERINKKKLATQEKADIQSTLYIHQELSSSWEMHKMMQPGSVLFVQHISYKTWLKLFSTCGQLSFVKL